MPQDRPASGIIGRNPVLAALILVVALARNHAANDVAALVALLVLVALGARWLLRDLRVHPANFPR